MKLPTPPTTASATFFKGHGHGNDYLVFREGNDWAVTREAVRSVCHRTRGLGGDGIVVVVPPDASELSRGPLAGLRMFNPDGLPFERSGNGLRIAAAALQAWGLVDSGEVLVHCWGEPLTMQIHSGQASLPPDGIDVSLELGTATVGPDAVAAGPELIGADGELAMTHPTFGALTVVGVSVGNPHVVVFGTDLSDEALHAVGPWVAIHPGLANGTNVQLADVVNDTVRIRIWERGVGPTTASGTSASAATVACVQTGRVGAGWRTVEMDGGEFEVFVGDGLRVVLRGPVHGIGSGKLSSSFLSSLRAL